MNRYGRVKEKVAAAMKKKKAFTFILCVTIALLSACGKWNGSGESVGKEVDFDALQIEEYTYPKEFTLGQNLESAITELALMFDYLEKYEKKMTVCCRGNRLSISNIL